MPAPADGGRSRRPPRARRVGAGGVVAVVLLAVLLAVVVARPHDEPGAVPARAPGAGSPTVAATVPTTAPADRWARAHRDDFDTLDRGVWGVYGGAGNGKTGPRATSNTFVRDGVLVLRTAPVDGVWKGAGLSSEPGGWTQTYGRYTARLRFEPGYGVRAVALLWPASGVWPPEVDFFEVPATEAARSRGLLTNHFVDPSSGDGRSFDRSEVVADFTRWHVVGVEWSPGLLVYTVDGAEVARSVDHVPDEPMWLGVQTAQGQLAEGIVPGPGRTQPVDLLVDWVEVERWQGSAP